MYKRQLLDALIQKYSLTILLKRNHKKIAIEDLPTLLFERNKKLRGGLTPIKCKSYADTDVNQNGTSRKKWRLIHLEGDEAFLASIAPFPDDHFFTLGAAGVQIRGGVQAESKKWPRGRDGEKDKDKDKDKNKATANPNINLTSVSSMLARASDKIIQIEETRERNKFMGTNKSDTFSDRANVPKQNDKTRE